MSDVSHGWWAMETYFHEYSPPCWRMTFDPHLPGWPQLFRTRRECREWIEEHHGYIRERPDLRAAPHHWRVPRAVMVSIVKASDDRRAPTDFAALVDSAHAYREREDAARQHQAERLEARDVAARRHGGTKR